MAIDILNAFSTTPPPIDYVIPGMVAGTVGALVSPGGSGKSAFALQLCAQVAGGGDILRLGNIKTGRATYLPAEDPETILLHRLAALGECYDQNNRERIAGNLLIEPLLAHHPNILNDDWYAAIKRIAAESRLVVIDTLRMFHNAEENDSGQMTGVVARFKRICADTGASLIFLHHTTKAAALQMQGSEQQASRGSSVLVDNVRWQGYLVNMTAEEAKVYGVDEDMRSYFVRFGISKQNYGKPFQPIWYRKTSARTPEIEGGFTLQPTHLVQAAAKKRGGKNGYSC
jgi:RecA-family ATPase